MLFESRVDQTLENVWSTHVLRQDYFLGGSVPITFTEVRYSIKRKMPRIPAIAPSVIPAQVIVNPPLNQLREGSERTFSGVFTEMFINIICFTERKSPS